MVTPLIILMLQTLVSVALIIVVLTIDSSVISKSDAIKIIKRLNSGG